MRINEMDPKITFGRTHYNPETGAFEATAKLQEGTAQFSYRVSLRVPPHAEFQTIVRGLKVQTLARHHDAQVKTHKLIRDTVRAVMTRANGSAFDGKKGRGISVFLSA